MYIHGTHFCVNGLSLTWLINLLCVPDVNAVIFISSISQLQVSLKSEKTAEGADSNDISLSNGIPANTMVLGHRPLYVLPGFFFLAVALPVVYIVTVSILPVQVVQSVSK